MFDEMYREEHRYGSAAARQKGHNGARYRTQRRRQRGHRHAQNTNGGDVHGQEGVAQHGEEGGLGQILRQDSGGLPTLLENAQEGQSNEKDEGAETAVVEKAEELAAKEHRDLQNGKYYTFRKTFLSRAGAEAVDGGFSCWYFVSNISDFRARTRPT